MQKPLLESPQESREGIYRYDYDTEKEEVMTTYNLVCPFLTDDPLFAYGVEFGLLYVRMQTARRIRDYFCRDNQERILLLANRLGWKVKKVEPFDKDWFWLVMAKD